MVGIVKKVKYRRLWWTDSSYAILVRKSFSERPYHCSKPRSWECDIKADFWRRDCEDYVQLCAVVYTVSRTIISCYEEVVT
jgi:hypothetical protein